MRFRSLALVLLGLIACAIEARADDNSDSNSSNNPVAPKLTLEYWNYYATSLNQLNGDAENGEGRVLSGRAELSGLHWHQAAIPGRRYKQLEYQFLSGIGC